MYRSILILVVALSLFTSIVSFSQTSAPIATAKAQVEEQPDINALAQRLAGEAKRLHDDTAARLNELSKLEEELQRGTANTSGAQQTVDSLLKLLNDAAGRLAPDATYRKTLDGEETIVRGLSREAATSADLDVRKLAEYFTKAATDIRNMGGEAEELRTRLVAQIDRLARLKERLRFTTAAAEVENFVKNARQYLDNVRSIADGTQNLANELENFGRGVPTQ